MVKFIFCKYNFTVYTSSCPGYSFRCNYGACIDSTAKCDGRVDCVDSSDETDLECPPLINEASPAKHCK